MIRLKSGLPYKTIQTDIYKPDKPCGKRISTHKIVTYEVCAVLSECRSCPRRRKLHIVCFRASTKSALITLLLLSPKSLTTFRGPRNTAALLRSYRRKIVSHSDGHSVVNGKTKSRYTGIKNRRELCSRFKMMFYVTALKFKTILFLCPSAADSTKQFMTAGSGIFS